MKKRGIRVSSVGRGGGVRGWGSSEPNEREPFFFPQGIYAGLVSWFEIKGLGGFAVELGRGGGVESRN